MGKNIFQVKRVNQQQTINSHRFSIRFVGLKNLLMKAQDSNMMPHLRKRFAAVQGALGKGDEIGESLEVALVSANIPQVQIEINDVPRFNDHVKQTTRFAAMEDFEVTFMDYVNGSASAILQLWHAFVGDKETGAMGFKQDFVLPEAEFLVYGPDAPGYEVSSSSEIPYLQKYAIINLFPRAINLGEHTSETPDPRRVTGTFVCDNVFPVDIRGYNYSAAVSKPEDRYTSTPDML